MLIGNTKGSDFICVKCKFQIKHGFISLYALLVTLAISLSVLHTVRTLSVKQDIMLMLYFQKQSHLYAKTLYDIALQCYKQYDSQSCKKDSIQFDPYFYGEYIFHDQTIKEEKSQHDIKVQVLDISIHSQTLLSTHPLRYAKRYIVDIEKGDI